ncbi:MAG: aconitate hydratase, partial [Parachlamydiaceae bacterium]|nr:aconitate hydratase [Parachlamydiaceae bacterium]
MPFDFDMIELFYKRFSSCIQDVRIQIQKPMTLTEKLFYSHLAYPIDLPESKEIYFLPDRVAMRDVNAQMALLQFAVSGRVRTMVPTSVHCDQLIIAELGSKEDLSKAQIEHKEIFDFLQSICGKYGVGFWKLGSGIINQVILENYAFPGGMLIGTDIYISNAGGLGMVAMSTGASDVVGVMAGMPLEIKMPKIIAISLTGKLQGWSAPKDVALKLWEILGENGAAGAVIEYFGEGAATLSCTGKSTICNMSAEAGAIASIFPYDRTMADYLIATGRATIATLADASIDCLKADNEVLMDPKKYYDQVIDIDLSTLEPRISGSQGIDKSWTLPEFANMIRQNGYSEKLSASLIGSCVNSSFEDMGKVASLARQAWKHGLKTKSSLMISPGSEKMRATLEREGQLKALEEIGSTMFASACGPCSGLWKRHDVTFGEKNSILTSFNRSYSGRFDGNPGTQAFVASPEIAVALALSGRLTFNPMTDALITAQGLPLRFSAPTGDVLPAEGFDSNHFGYSAPGEEGLDIPIMVDPDSKRLMLLKPFEPWSEKDFIDMRILIKSAGKAGAEQIAPSGKWLRFRGHLDSVSDNLGGSLANSFREEIGKGKNLLNGEIEPYSNIARCYKKEGISWIIVAEENYGEGSSCDLIAMEPRHLGGKVVVAKSYSPDCERNLKRQGLLTLTFSRWEDYEKLREDDLLDFIDIKDFALDKPIELLLKHADGTTE